MLVLGVLRPDVLRLFCCLEVALDRKGSVFGKTDPFLPYVWGLKSLRVLTTGSPQGQGDRLGAHGVAPRLFGGQLHAFCDDTALL